MFKFKPDMYKKDIYEINYEKLQDLGIKYLFFDLDNTIITYKENMPNDKIMTLFFRLEEIPLTSNFIDERNYVLYISENYDKNFIEDLKILIFREFADSIRIRTVREIKDYNLLNW